MKTLLLIFLSTAFVVNAIAQSGRRVSTSRPPTPTAPIQAPLNPEPEPPPARVGPAELTFLPDTLLERPIKSLDNTTFRLSDFGGKVVVINMWASWCGPCRREVPEYEKVRKAFAGKAVEFIGLTTEDPHTAGDQVRAFVRQVNFGFRLGWADRESARTLMNGRGAIPQTLVIGLDRRVVNRWTGYASGQSGRRLTETIDHALSEAP
jgi:thiol-disulfide isomerase/thioredoxin